MGYIIYATNRTHIFLSSHGINSIKLEKPGSEDGKKPSVIEFLRQRKIDIVVNVPENLTRTEITDGYKIRRCAVDFGVPLFTNPQAARLLVNALHRQSKMPTEKQVRSIKPWRKYLD